MSKRTFQYLVEVSREVRSVSIVQRIFHHKEHDLRESTKWDLCRMVVLPSGMWSLPKISTPCLPPSRVQIFENSMPCERMQLQQF